MEWSAGEHTVMNEPELFEEEEGKRRSSYLQMQKANLRVNSDVCSGGGGASLLKHINP